MQVNERVKDGNEEKQKKVIQQLQLGRLVSESFTSSSL